LEGLDPTEAVRTEVRADVERAMGAAMARISALRTEVDGAVEARLTPLLSRLRALEDERVLLRRTVNLAAPNPVAGLRVEVDALADRLAALASGDERPEPGAGAAKPRVTMLSSTKI
jgi:NAD-specific glutamate dehydrogenase